MTKAGELLLHYRTRRGTSKYRLAAATGISHSNIFKIEKGERNLTADHIARIIPALNLEVDEIEGLIQAVCDERCADLDALLQCEYVRLFPNGIVRAAAPQPSRDDGSARARGGA